MTDPNATFEDSPEAEAAAIARLQEQGLLPKPDKDLEAIMDADRAIRTPELQALFDQAQRDILNWIPTTSGQEVGGVLRDITDVDADFVEGGTVPMLVIESPSGVLWGVRAYHSVLRNEIERRIEKGRLQIGYTVAIVYTGKGGDPNRKLNQYENYRLAVKPQ
jgi:hypothetical protein